MRALARVYNRFPVRWQRRFLDASHDRFLVGVAGIGVDPAGRLLLARHRFGTPQWRFLGGFVRRGERLPDALAREVREETGLTVEVGPVLEVSTGFRWARIEIVFPFRVIGGGEALSSEVLEIGWFRPDELPGMRADQLGMVDRHAAAAIAWVRAQA